MAAWSLRLVLFVRDFFHPVDRRAVELFSNGKVTHGRRCRGAVPMLFPGREPNHITRSDFFDWATLALDPAKACHDEQGLTERVGVPRCARPRFESDKSPPDTGWIRRVEGRVNAHSASEILCRPFG